MVVARLFCFASFESASRLGVPKQSNKARRRIFSVGAVQKRAWIFLDRR
jgi:hypothetical protein